MTMTTVTTTAEEREAILEAVRDFADTELAPHAAERDEKHIFPRESLNRAGELGLGGIYVREDFGGSGLSRRHLRGARQGRHRRRRVHLDPQHGRLDDRHLRR